MLRFLLLSLFLPISIILQAQDDYKQYLNLSYAEIDSLVMIEYQNGAYANAIPLMQAGRVKAKREFGEQDSIFAEYTNNLGFFYGETGQYYKALPLYTQAKDIYQKVLGKEHPDFALSLNNLANVHKSMGNYDKALPLYTQARDIREKVLGKEHPDFAMSLNSLANVHKSMGNYDKALLLYTQARDIREKVLGKEHTYFTNSLNSLGLLHKIMGNYDKALLLYTQARDIREKVLGKEHPYFATSLNNLAALHQSMGNYNKALPLYMQARDIREKVLGKEHSYFANSLSNLAVLHSDMGNYDKALPLYTEAKDIYQKVLGKEHPDFALSLNNLADLHENMGNYDKALLLYTEAKDIYQKVLGKEHPDFALSLNNLADLHESMGNYDKALLLFTQARDIRGKVLGKEHPYFAMSLNNLANVHQSMGKTDKAWEMLHLAINSQSRLQLNHSFDEKWLDSLKNAHYPSNQHIGEVVSSLRIAYQTLKKDSSIADAITKQAIVADLATALLMKFRNQVSNEKDKLRMLSQSNDWLLRSLEVLTPQANNNKAFNRADENKSVLLLQATKSEAAYRLGELPDSLVWQRKKMLKKKSQLQVKMIEKRPKAEKDSLRNELIDVNQELDDFVALIKKEYPKYHKLKYQQIETKAEDIQALLDEETALLEYVIADSVLHIFCVDKNEVIWKQQAVLDSVLKAKIETLHASLSDYQQISKKQEKNFESYTQLAHWFYQTTVAPVLKGKDGIKNLIIITDGELGHLPFESFLVEPLKGNNYKDLHYLLKDYKISYNYSASLWQENKTAKKQSNNGQMLAMAAYYSENIDSNLVRGRLPTVRWMREALFPLPAAKEEVEALAEQFKGYFAFDSLASEKVFWEKASDYAIIHLAMHGLLDENRPILSSLALTENGDSLYDNFLQAHEVSKMELNADLVVLSACETGYGRFETGNGIASLARSFMYAGVPALVVSLWQVNDQSTSIIMQNFYKHLASGMTKSAALRQAKLDYIEKVDNPIAAHPAFWSPFILIGDESPVELQKKSSNWLWWALGVGALLLAGLGFGLARRRKAA